MRRLPRTWTIAIALTLTLTTPLTANAGNPRRDITNTPRGQQLADESAARFDAQGVPTEASDLAVIELPDGGVTVLPARLSDRLVVSSQVVDGSQRFTATVDVGDTLASASTSGKSGGTLQAAAAAYWAYRESGCFASMYVSSARFDVCYKISKLINDGSTSKDWYGLEQWGTAFESGAGLRSAFVSGQRRTGSNTQNWDGRWSPSTSLTKNCVSYFIGITHFVTLGANYEVCEKWTITKSANGTSPYFKTEWGCNSFACGVQQTDRDVAYTIETALSQGLTPLYTLGYGMGHW